MTLKTFLTLLLVVALVLASVAGTFGVEIKINLSISLAKQTYPSQPALAPGAAKLQPNLACGGCSGNGGGPT